jgi:hypothetical protein
LERRYRPGVGHLFTDRLGRPVNKAAITNYLPSIPGRPALLLHLRRVYWTRRPNIR